MKETYGDLNVTITTSVEGKIQSSEVIYVGYNQYENHAELDLRDFPY